MTAHSASVPDTAALRKCRLCGMTGYTISPGIYQLKSGKFVTIDRCEDHGACLARREEARRK